MLVVGGGLAALAAAISAVDNGATVLLVNKGISGKSGSSAKAAGILAAAFGHGDLETRPVPDNPNKHALETLEISVPPLDLRASESHVVQYAWCERAFVRVCRVG